MVYITGDTHGEFKHIKQFCSLAGTTKSDVLIILGDSGLNYFTDLRALRYKEAAERLPIKLFCIHGNHEERASNIKSYKKINFWGAKALIEDAYPNLIFALDGEVYKIPTSNGTKETLVIGGAYSVDKYYRLMCDANWFKSEQPSQEIKSKVEKELANRDWKIDIVLSHTCPYRYMPYEWFLGGIDQNTVDNSTEKWLDSILSRIKHLENWYCGHFHGEKIIDKINFMFNSIKEF